MQTTRVLVDANVLFSRTLRDWLALIYLAAPIGGLYTVHWTEDILAEVIYNLRRKHPTWSGKRISAVRERIVATFADGLVEDFAVDGSYPGRDRDDQHVHAAALACSADIVLTKDLDFGTARTALADQDRAHTRPTHRTSSSYSPTTAHLIWFGTPRENKPSTGFGFVAARTSQHDSARKAARASPNEFDNT